MTFKCLYCNEVREDSGRSLEHIIPSFIGTKRRDGLFVTKDVCKKCNTRYGLWVDSAIARSWLRKAEDYISALQFADLENGSAFPLFYFGTISDIELREGLVCDGWLGPAGDQIFHVRPQDEDFGHLAGGNPKRQVQARADNRVYFYARSSTPFWLISLFKSVKSYFEQSEIFFMTPGLFDLIKNNPHVMKVYEERKPIRGHIWHADRAPADEAAEIGRIQRTGGLRSHRLQIRIDSDLRFMCKVALGFRKILTGEHPEGKLPDRFRDILRFGFKEDQTVEFPFKSMWGDSDEFSFIRKIVTPPGSYAFLVLPVEGWIMLFLIGPTRACAFIALGEAKDLDDLAPHFRVSEGGMAVVTYPQFDYVSRVFELGELVAFSIGNYGIPELQAILDRRTDRSALPDNGGQAAVDNGKDVVRIVREFLLR